MANLFTSLLAAFRVAKAKRIVADQRVLIARLRAAGQPTLDAESSLQIYLSALKLLEAPEQRKSEKRIKRKRAKQERIGLLKWQKWSSPRTGNAGGLVVGTTKVRRATFAPFKFAPLGAHPGFRAKHANAKGIVVEGSFKASSEAPLLSKAKLFDGSTIPMTVQFSDSTGIPNLPDGSDLANPHGMAIKFHLPDGSDVGMVTNSLKFFLVSRGADSAICSWPSLLARPTRPSQHSASATGPKPDFVPRPRDALPQTSDIDRKTALADTGTTSWQTTARENKPRCDGRCVQSRYLATAAPFCQ